MSVRSLNWLKFGALAGLAFVLGLMFAGLLNLPDYSLAQTRKVDTTTPARALTTSNQATTASASMGATPLAAFSDAFAAVAEQVRPSVVYIRSRRTEREADRRQVPQGFEEFFNFRQRGRTNEPQVETGSGSGFLVSDDGYILTNNHVVAGADEVTVRLLDRHEFKAKVVGTDPNTDVAVIKIEAKGNVHLRPVALGSSARTRVGEWVLAVGNPLAENLSFTVTSGIISAKGRGQLPLPGRERGTVIQDFLQTDAAINRGNSGGPLLNVRGEVIGINSAIFTQTGFSVGYAFAIPIDLARQVMQQLIEHGKVERAALGVQVQDATAEDAEYVGLDEIRGVRIQSFSSDRSPAKAAGLVPGDIVVSVDGQNVEYTAQLQQLVGFRRPGETVKVEVARKGGVRKTFNVRLMSQQESTELAQAGSDSAEDERPERTRNTDPEVKNRLGVEVTSLGSDAAQQFDIPSNIRGVLVEKVDPYGPADGLLFAPNGSPAGIDVITAIEGQPVRSESDLRAALRSFRPGEVVSLSVYTPPIQNAPAATRIVRLRLSNK
jgi:serine protease Do